MVSRATSENSNMPNLFPQPFENLVFFPALSVRRCQKIDERLEISRKSVREILVFVFLLDERLLLILVHGLSFGRDQGRPNLKFVKFIHSIDLGHFSVTSGLGLL